MCTMGEGEVGFVCSSNSMRSEDTDNTTACQQSGEASFAVSTCNSLGVVQRAVPSSIPQRLGVLPQDADALHKWNDSDHVGTSTAADPSEEENAQCSSKGTDATCNASEQLGSDCLRLEGTGIIAEGIASVLGPVMREFDGRAEGALKSQGILASSIDRLTRELDKLLDDAPIPFIIQHATKISSVRKRVSSLNSTLQCIQKRIDHIERMLSGQERTEHEEHRICHMDGDALAAYSPYLNLKFEVKIQTGCAYGFRGPDAPRSCGCFWIFFSRFSPAGAHINF